MGQRSEERRRGNKEVVSVSNSDRKKAQEEKIFINFRITVQTKQKYIAIYEIQFAIGDTVTVSCLINTM